MKIFKYILPLAAMPLLFVSCSPEEDDLFEASAIERLEADAATTMDILCSAENGWEMLYFLNDEQDIPCYTLLVKFTRGEQGGLDGMAQFASYSDVTGDAYRLSEESPFTVTLDNSTVLSFNSYNSIFHIFSDPSYQGERGPTDSDYPYDLGRGMMGDYEFMVVDHSNPDVVMLKGKKRQVYSVLRRLSSDVDWQGYFTQLNATKTTMFASNPSPLRLVVGDKSFHLYNGSSSIFQVVDGATDDGMLTAATDWKFVLFSDGLRFITNFDEDGVSAGQDFFYNSERTRMESHDENGNLLAYIDGGDPYWFFNRVNTPDATTGNTAHNWGVTYDGMGAIVKAVYDQIYATAWGQRYNLFEPTFACLSSVGNVLGITGNGLSFSNVYYSLVKTSDDDARTVTYSLGDAQRTVSSIFTATDGAMETFYGFFDNGATYRFETVTPFTLSTIRMINVADETISFNVVYK